MKKKLSLFITLCILITSVLSCGVLSTFATDVNVARITYESGGVTITRGEYTDIKTAAAALKEGDTLTLLTDVTTDQGEIQIKVPATIDGGGHTLTVTTTGKYAFCAVGSAPSDTTKPNTQVIRFQNMKIDSVGGGFKPYAGVTMVLGADMDVRCRDNPVFLSPRVNTKYIIEGGYYSCSVKGPLFDSYQNTGANIEIKGGCFVQASSSNSLLKVKSSTVTITGGRFESAGSHVVEAENSTVNIYGGYFLNKATSGSCRAFHGNTSTSNTLNIWGGTFVNNSGTTVYTGGTVKVYGGEFYNYGADKVLAVSDNESSSLTVLGGAMYAVKKLGGNVTDEGSEQNSNGLYLLYNTQRSSTVKGAAVRLVTDSTGIRFTSNVPVATLDYANFLKDEGTEVSYGTIITPKDQLTGIEVFTKDAMYGKEFVEVEATEVGTEVAANGDIIIRAALVDLQTENYDREFAAVSYVKYTVNGNEVYLYGSFDLTDNSRSMSYIAQAALDDLSDTEGRGYQYPVGDKYSPYTEAQRAVLATYIVGE